MKLTVAITALVLALLVDVGTAPAAGTSPVVCFRSHGWIVKGTARKGKATPPHGGFVDAFWFPTSYGRAWGTIGHLTARQRRVVKTCLA